MIISLAEAKEIDNSLKQEDLDAIEVAIRALTNNKFQNVRIRYHDIVFISNNRLGLDSAARGLKEGDTVEINYSGYNDGLYVIESVLGDVVTFNSESFEELDLDGAMLTKIEYPADIKRGVKRMLKYDEKMEDKLGVKQESYARMSVTYHDVNATDNTEGYPSSLLSFLSKYEKMRW